MGEGDATVAESIVKKSDENVEMGMYLFRHLLGFPESYLANCLYFSSNSREWRGSLRLATEYAEYSPTWTAKAMKKMVRSGLVIETGEGYVLNFCVSSCQGDFTVTMTNSVFSACEKVFKADIDKAVLEAEKLFEEGRDPDEVANILVLPPGKE